MYFVDPGKLRAHYVPPRFGNTSYQSSTTSTSSTNNTVGLGLHGVALGLRYTRPLPPVKRRKNFFERLADILERL